MSLLQLRTYQCASPESMQLQLWLARCRSVCLSGLFPPWTWSELMQQEQDPCLPVGWLIANCRGVCLANHIKRHPKVTKGATSIDPAAAPSHAYSLFIIFTFPPSNHQSAPVIYAKWRTMSLTLTTDQPPTWPPPAPSSANPKPCSAVCTFDVRSTSTTT